LDAFDDPVAAHARRGAHWTFDAEGFVKLVERVVTCPDEVILAPSFNHGAGDPVEKDISIERHHSIVIVEGNYLLLGRLCCCHICLAFVHSIDSGNNNNNNECVILKRYFCLAVMQTWSLGLVWIICWIRDGILIARLKKQ
jgi:hypothetical protein